MNNEIRIRQQNSKKFSKIRNHSISEGVSAAIGFKKDGTSCIQSFIFDKTHFDLPKAKNWVRDYNSKLKESFSVLHMNLDKNPIQNPMLDTKSMITSIVEGVKDVINNVTPHKEVPDRDFSPEGFNLLEGENALTADSFRITIQESLIPGTAKANRAKVRLIVAGESKNGNIYSATTLGKAAHLFENLPVYLNHKDNDRDVEDKVGWYSDVKFTGDSLEATANIFETETKVWDMIKNQVANPNAKICALSINAFGKGKVLNEGKGGRVRRQVEEITHAISTDIVDNPSAGGKILELMESIKNESKTSKGEVSMDLVTLKEKHPEIVQELTNEISLKLKEEFPPKKEDPDGDKKKCPKCGKEYTMKESFDHMVEELKASDTELETLKESNKNTKFELLKHTIKDSISGKLKDVELAEATKERLALILVKLGEEVREGDKPSNWDLAITEETDYAKKLVESVKPKDLKTSSEKNGTDNKANTEPKKLTESEQMALAKSIASSL